MTPRCIGCRKEPHEIQEYVDRADEAECLASDIVKWDEGTYNPENGHFACTECYIGMGMPSSPQGWIAP